MKKIISKPSLAFCAGALTSMIGFFMLNYVSKNQAPALDMNSDERLLTAFNFGYWQGFDVVGETGAKLFVIGLDDPSVAIQSKCATHLGRKYPNAFKNFAPKVWAIITKIDDDQEQQVLLTYYLGVVKPTDRQKEKLIKDLQNPAVFIKAQQTLEQNRTRREKQPKSPGTSNDNK